LAGVEPLAGEQRGQELRAGPARAMENQDGIAHPTRGIAQRVAERAVVQPQLGQHLAARESEVVDNETARVSLRRHSGEEQEDRRAHAR